MGIQKIIVLSLSAALGTSALAVQKRASCPSYTIVDTRGTFEGQGPSLGFLTMNKNILAQLSGGKEYDTVYAAGIDQDSAPGSEDIANHIVTTLASNPSECFFLEGYSQGAAATVDALKNLTGSAFDAVKGVFLIGDPYHTAGLACNIDNKGGNETFETNGLSVGKGIIPSNWISKTLDVCAKGDIVCDTTNGGLNFQHLDYPGDADTQNIGTQFAVRVLSG